MMKKKSDTTLEINKILNADVEDVWEALTQQKLLKKWFYPGGKGWSAEIDFEPEVDRSYRIVMIDPEGSRYVHEGIFKEVIEGRKLVFTWNSAAVQDTVVTIQVTEQDDATEVRLIHEFMPAEQKERHREGWSEILQKLQQVTATE